MTACSDWRWLRAAATFSVDLVSGVAAFDASLGEAESAQLSGLLARSS